MLSYNNEDLTKNKYVKVYLVQGKKTERNKNV